MRNEPGPWQLWTRKHFEGGSPSDGSVEDVDTQDGEGAGSHDGAIAHLEKQGDPEVPGGTCRDVEQSLEVGGSSERGGHEGASLRPVDGVSQSVFRPTDSPNSSKALSLYEGFIQRDTKFHAATWHSHAGAQSGPTRITNYHPV